MFTMFFQLCQRKEIHYMHFGLIDGSRQVPAISAMLKVLKFRQFFEQHTVTDLCATRRFLSPEAGVSVADF